MADEADIAGEAQGRWEAAQLAAVRAAAHKRDLTPGGVCHWCDAPAAAGRLFCDADCAADWQRADAAHRRSYGTGLAEKKHQGKH